MNKIIFQGLRIYDFGFFDSEVVFPYLKSTVERTTKYYEIEFIVKESGGMTVIGGEEIPFNIGRCIISKPGKPRHSVLDTGSFQCYYIHLLTDDPATKEALDRLPTTFFVRNVDYYINEIQENLQNDGSSFSGGLRYVSSTLRILSALFEENPITDLPAYQCFTMHKEILLRAKEYMDAHYAEEIDLETLCRISNLSPSYFHRLFSDAFGISPGKYLQNVRMDVARLLLITTNKPISEVAALSGFSSQHYFTGRFKNAYAISPLRFRHLMQSREEI